MNLDRRLLALARTPWLALCLTIVCGVLAGWLTIAQARGFSLDIWNAASSPYTLKVVTIVAAIFVPIILAYQAYTYWIFRKRISSDKGKLVY